MLKFLDHFAAVRTAVGDQGLWDDRDGLFYDRLMTPDGTVVPVEVRSMVGVGDRTAGGPATAARSGCRPIRRGRAP